ncbi:hypothetical protein QQX98_002749 [Neonectria punicea]|uniref:PD-(D/E)XK nuclease-like domain-containing protein n=1 Tax=Neonectria punicea TaxID=979145 RepID=A0ABR1HHD0_9HYPO
MGNDNDILEWLESVAPAHLEEPSPSSLRPRKRPRLNNEHTCDYHQRKTQNAHPNTKRARSRLTTHAASVSAPTSWPATRSGPNGDSSLPTIPPKHPRDPDNYNNDDDQDDRQRQQSDFAPAQTIDVTPRPFRRSAAAISLSDAETGSQTPSSSRASSSKASKISRHSSPTKQLHNASLRETGFSRASIEDDKLPMLLGSLTQSLWKIDESFGVFPKGLQDDLAGERVREWMFGDSPEFETSQLPDTQTVRKIFRLAKRCFQENLAESSWNNDVHSQMLEWAMRDSSSNDDLLDYRYCLTARIVPPYQPENAPSKMVDFCICLQPEATSPQYHAIRSLCISRPSMSINHTDWGDLTKYPVAIYIETKGPEQSYETALLQMATWHSSQ